MVKSEMQGRSDRGGEAGRAAMHVRIHKVHRLARNGLLRNGQRQVNAPVQQHLEQQVFSRAVFADVVDLIGQQVLGHRIGGVEHLLHVGAIDFEYAKA